MSFINTNASIRRGPGRLPALFLATCLAGLASCGHNDDDTTIIVDVQGVLASDLQSIAEYLDLAEVDALFTRGLSRFSGSPAAPDISGTFDSTGKITFTTYPGSRVGEDVVATFCFGTPSGADIDARIEDPTFQDAGAGSFIEANGNRFTIYVAFKSAQTGPFGKTCEIHQVAIFSGERLADGSLTGLEIGSAIIGVVGDCGSLLPGDIQLSSGLATRSGASCFTSPPLGPNEVRVLVVNDLLTSMDVFISDDGFATIDSQTAVPGNVSREIVAPAGFQLAFESVPPKTAGGAEMGELMAATFPADNTAAGQTSTYVINNDIGGDLFFAPVILNHTNGNAYSVTNVGIGNTPPGDTSGGWDCNCILAPSPTEQYFVGYYSYDVPSLNWMPQEVNVFLFNADTPAFQPFVFDKFETPAFALEANSGSVGLLIEGSW